MAVDGSLKFDTKIDTGGFNKGVGGIKQSCNSMMSSFKKIGAAVGVSFGINAIIQFSKTSIQASNDIENAMIGLKSIIEGQGRDFSQANKFIKEYTSDGLIPATEAVTAYKNLAMRGYTDPQIQSTLIALKDSAAFGRQASLSMGQAVSGATEGLKNENSLLVDNAGVTKNVSMMWEDYAKSIGVGTKSLTKQQKIQAEVQGIMEETRFQTGDAAKVADTYSGSILRLQFSLNDMKIAFGNFLKPIISAVLPVINSAITAFTRFFNVIAQVSTLLFGKKVFATDQAKEQESALGGAVKNEKDLAKATDKASKAANNQLASFDEINVLAKETTDSVDTGGGEIPTGGGNAGGTGGEIGGNVEVSPKIVQAVDFIKSMLEPLKSINLDNLKLAFDNFKVALEPFTSTIFEGLKWAWDNLLVPLGKWAIEDALPKWLNACGEQFRFFGELLNVLKPLGSWLWDSFLKPFLSWAGDKYLQWLDLLADGFNGISNWIKDNQSLVEVIVIVIGSFALAWGLVTIAVGLWNAIGAIATAVTTAFGAAVAFLTSPIGIVILAIGAIIAIIVLLVKNWDLVKATAISCWEWIKKTWSKVASWFDKSVVQPICGFFSALWDGIAYGAKMLWWGIQVGAIGMVNFVILAINAMIDGILAPFNLLINAMNLIPGVAIPKLDFNIPTIKLPPIPKLAMGAVIPPNREFMAVLGDQKHGTNIETPLDTMVQAFKMANADSNRGGETVIRFTGSLSELVRILKPEIDKENSRRGTKLIIGTV